MIKAFLICSFLFSIQAFSEHKVEKLLSFKKIPKGKFYMGSPRKESRRFSDEKKHRVRISKDFYMSVYEITQMQWFLVMGNNPSSFSRSWHCKDTHTEIGGFELCPDLPVDNIKYIKAIDFINALNQESKYKYRLPTEAEWEYAARAGNEGVFIDGFNNGDQVYSYAWFDETSFQQTHAVGTKEPNAWGLHDMTGNVWEWVSDWYNDRYYNRSPRKNPLGPKTGEKKVMRGGSYYSPLWVLRIAHRGYSEINDDLNDQSGFRIIRE